MGDRRMFSRKVVETDLFLDLPLTAQALYFHLGLNADDDGFVDNPNTVRRLIGASDDDFRILISKQFLIAFASGVIVITHWKLSNTVQNDRYHPTIYEQEKAMLTKTSSGKYVPAGTIEKGSNPNGIQDVSKMYSNCIQDGSNVDTEPNLTKTNITKPNVTEQKEQNNSCSERSKIAREPEADVEAIILNDKSEWRPTQEDFEEYVRLFPGVDVVQQFREMRAWCMANPTRCKTRSGVKRFINNWLRRAQDKPVKKGYTGNAYIDAVNHRFDGIDEWPAKGDANDQK